MSVNNGTLPPIFLPLNAWGKASKEAILKDILRREEAHGEAADYKRIILIAQKELEKYPAEQREGVVFNKGNVFSARSQLKLDRAKNKKTAKPASRLPQEAPKPAPAKAQPEMFVLRDIIAVKTLLETSNGSLVEAQRKLNRLFVALQENP